MPRSLKSPIAKAIDAFLDLPVGDRKIVMETVAVVAAREKLIPAPEVVKTTPAAQAAPAKPAGKKRGRKPRVKPQPVVDAAQPGDQYDDPGPSDVVGQE